MSDGSRRVSVTLGTELAESLQSGDSMQLDIEGCTSLSTDLTLDKGAL